MEPGSPPSLDESSVANNVLHPETEVVVVGSPEIMKLFTGYAGHDFSTDICAMIEFAF